MKFKRIVSFALAGTMLLGSTLCASAEEVTPKGYHVYEISESEVIDSWYSVGRGEYLDAAVAKLIHVDNTHVKCSGQTFALMDCPRVFVRAYLDQSETAQPGSWGTIDYWTDIQYDASMAYATSGSYRVDRGYFYRVTGSHSVTPDLNDEFCESTTTCTDALSYE